MKPKPMLVLTCASMCHVVDRAWAFRFIERRWDFYEVRPDGVVMRKPDGELVKVEAKGYSWL